MALPDASTNKNLEGAGFRATVQRFGGYLAGMIMPNIGALIAWGLITAFFIPDGWWPNESMAAVVGPTITYLIPILIGYTAGRMVHGQRGAVVGAVATMGVVVVSESPMLLGAMIIGPIAGFAIKKVDQVLQDRAPSGFEMLIDTFSAGIVGALGAATGIFAIGPAVRSVTSILGSGVDWLITNNLLPLASVLVEPAKVLFLNNAINHGVMTPLAIEQTAEAGKSILFMVESNPGPGLGILIAFMLFGPRAMRASTPGAIVIHFFGGIHEIYFPYVLMKPVLLLAAIAGGASGVLTGIVFNAGLVAAASPGSILAYMAMTPRGGHFAVLASVFVAAVVSFSVAAVLLGFGRGERKAAAEEAAAEQAAQGSTV